MMLVSFVFPARAARDDRGLPRTRHARRDDTGLFTASWLSIGWAEIAAPPGAKSVALGVYLLGFATVALLQALLSTLGKPFFSVLLLGSAARMVLSACYEIGGGETLNHVGGGFGLALAALALYGGTALALEDARHRELLPLFRRGGAVQAFEGYDAQLARLESEPGVRQQL